MTTPKKTLLAVGALAALGTAAATAIGAVGPAPAAAQAAKAKAAEPQRCVDNRGSGETRMSASGGWFLQSRGSWWQNRAAGCKLFAPGRIVVSSRTLGPHCSGDGVQLVDPISEINFGQCVLGSWEPVTAEMVPPARERP